MRLSKFLTLVFSLTLLSVLYVYQQTQIIRLAYTGEKQSQQFEELLNKNNVLRYHVGKSVSLVSIGEGISNSPDFGMPLGYRVVHLASIGARQRGAGQPKESMLASIFGIKRQAQAQTLNP